ncbi:hypothetical protein ACJW31_11G171200 [Castanea mollissima]
MLMSNQYGKIHLTFMVLLMSGVCCITLVEILKCMASWMQSPQVLLMPHVSKNSTMVGVGMCMEGIEQNPVVYELMSEMAFRSEKKVQLLEWLKSYSHRRYGKAIHQVEAAWEILYHTIYNCTDVIEDHNTDFIVKFPDWDPSNTSSPLPQAHLWYSTQKVIKALRLLIDAGNNFARSVTYRLHP